MSIYLTLMVAKMDRNMIIIYPKRHYMLWSLNLQKTTRYLWLRSYYLNRDLLVESCIEQIMFHSTCLLVCLSACLPICLFAYLLVCLFACLTVCLFACLLVSLSSTSSSLSLSLLVVALMLLLTPSHAQFDGLFSLFQDTSSEWCNQNKRYEFIVDNNYT